MRQQTNSFENLITRRVRTGRLRRFVAMLSAFVLLTTMNTLKLNADTLERIATCGIAQHVHDESCYDADGELACGLEEHVHTDACYQQRPTAEDKASTRIDGYVPLDAQVRLASPVEFISEDDEDTSVEISDVDDAVDEVMAELQNGDADDRGDEDDIDLLFTPDDEEALPVSGEDATEIDDTIFEVEGEEDTFTEIGSDDAVEMIDAPIEGEVIEGEVTEGESIEGEVIEGETIEVETTDEENTKYTYELGDSREVLLSTVLEALGIQLDQIDSASAAKSDEAVLSVALNEDGDYVITALEGFEKGEIVVVGMESETVAAYIIAITAAKAEEETEVGEADKAEEAPEIKTEEEVTEEKKDAEESVEEETEKAEENAEEQTEVEEIKDEDGAEEVQESDEESEAAEVAIVENDNVTIVPVGDNSLSGNLEIVYNENVNKQSVVDRLDAILSGAYQPGMMSTSSAAMSGLALAGASAGNETAGQYSDYAVFDISLLDDGVQRSETGEVGVVVRPENVNIYDNLPGNATATNVEYTLYHIHNSAADTLPVSVDCGEDGSLLAVDFTTDSFSYFVLKYTVEYTTDNNEVTVKLDFTDIVKNGVDFDTNSVITALNDGVSVSISELEQGYIEGTDSVVNGELYIDYTTADNKNENIKNVNWIGFNVVSADEGLTVADGKIKVTKDGTVVLSDGISTVTVVISNYEKLVAKELTSQGVDIEVLGGEVPAGSEVSYTALDEAKTSELVEQYNIDSDVEGVAHTAFDVSIAMPEGGNYTESGEFAVAVDLPVDEKAGDFKLYHIHEGQVEELPVEVVDGKVLFTTNSFSEFVLSYTVDFEYNGYQFSMPGGGVLLLSELFEQLHIEEDVADVVDVTFTDYDLLKIEKLNAGDSYRLYIDTFKGFTEEDLDAMEPNTVISADKTAIDRIVNTDNWLITSLKPFNTPEQLTITMDGGDHYDVYVTDAMETNSDGSVKMESIATIRTSVSKKITQTEQERDASFDINMGVLLTKEGLHELQEAVKASTTDPKTIPPIVYDFSSIVAGSPIEGMISATTVDLKDDGDVVGTITIDPSGKAIIQYNDPAWVTRKTAIAANILVSVGTNETNIPNTNQYTWEFPASNSITVKYKKNYSTEAKKYELTGSPETGYTATYTAKFKSTSDMQKLTFTDTLGGDDLQKLNQGSITVTKDGQDVTSQWTKKSADDHGFVIEASNQPAGEYTVSYTTSITKEQYEAMQVGSESWESNSAKWNLNGGSDIPGGDTTFKIDKPKPPEPPVTVTKDSDKEDQEVSRGGDINYTVRFESTKLNGLRINDKMTDVQILDPSSVVLKIDGQTVTVPSGFVNYYNDNSFSTWNMTDVFNYTFPDDGPYTEKTDGSKYSIEVTYKTTLIDQETAKANNIFDGVSVDNVAEEGRYYEKDKTTSTVTFDREVIHTVDKTAKALNVDVDGKWVPGTQVNYVIKVGDGTTDLADVHVVDKMTGLQKLNSGSVQISYGDDQHYSPLTTGIVYDDSQEYTANQVDVLDFALPQSAGYGPVYIKYSTTVMSQEDATRLGIYDPKAVNNDVNVGDKGHDGTSGTVPYLPEPKFPLTKEVDIAATEKEDSGATKLGGRVNYHLSFGDATIEDMSNVVIRDEMTDVQKLVGDVVVRLSQPLAADITLQDGTVVRAGEQSFVMPTSSSEGANDGVVWAAWLDDGKYSLDRNVRVFYYKLPEGVGKGPIYVDYAVDVIDEEEAKKAGINDTHNVYNTAISGNNSQTTEYPVDFPKNLPHTPYVEKEWEGWDMAKKAVKWKIIVDKTADSAYPIENVKITERLTNESNIQSPEINGGTYTIKSWEIDMVNAVLTTESGRTLVMGEDYEIYKGGLVNGSDTMPYFLIYNLTEKVIIHLSYATDLSIIQDYKATNKVKVEGGNESTVSKTYTSPEFTLSKTGEIVSTPDQPDLENHIVKWTVLINPTRVQVEEPASVTFSDLLPKGMTLVDGYKWQNDKEIDTTNPTIIVAYNQANYEYAVSTVPDADNYIAPVVISPSDRTKLKGVRYDITYYTYIDDAEWERITSSAGGAKTYDNTVTIKADGIIKNGETEVTIKSDEYIKKTDETKTGNYLGVDNKTHMDVVVDDEGNGTDYVSYKIEINPNAAALNRVDPVNPGDTVTYDPITLTDHISTNMDFDPTTLVIKKYGTPKDESTLTEVTAASEGLVVSYNDDTRLLAIAGLHDKTAYRIEYKNKVRTQGEDTFVNTATLTGGGSHSSTTSEKHKFENVNGESISYDMELDLRKIKETDITQYLPGVTFELWEVELAIDPSTLTDAQWEQLYIDTNNDEYSPWMLDSFKMVGKKKLDTVTTTEENKGVVRLPHEATGSEDGIQINPLTVYYWIETENTNPDFKAENVPHYFVLYPDKKMAWVDEDGNIVDEGDENAKKVVRVVLSDEEKAKHQRYAWALDNLFSEANKAIVASMSSGVTWSVNNLETKYTTISATKTWKGDADNLFETRPNDGIKLTLYQKLGDGEWVVYDPKNPENETPRVNQNPVIIRGSTYTTTENGKTVTKEDWPKANWLRLPAYKIEKVLNQESRKWDDVIVGYYTYKVVEDPVENYTTEYVAERKDENGEDIDLENDGVSGGIIDVTNTYIPPTTKIGVHKNFKVLEGTALPEQIIVHLMQIRTDKDGNVYDPVDYGITRMLTEQNDWSELFTGLPTRDGNGNTFTYTVVEDTDALEDDGFTYTQTEYVLDGVKDPTSGGLISGTIEINNHGPGSLKIEKNVTINSVPAEVGDSGADGTYTFHVMRKVNDELVEITDTYENGTPKSPVTITIENGASNYAMVTGLDAGDYYIHEDEPTNGTSLTGGNDVKVVVVGGVDDPDAVNVGSFTNNIDKTRVKVHKTWVNANRDAEGNIINGTNHEWPRGMTVQMELRKVQDGQAEHVKVDTPTWYSQNNKTWSDTIVLNAVRQFGVFDNLDELEDGWTYVVDETIIGDNPERFEAFIGEVDEDGNIEIVNAEKTQALFTKKWENTSNESGEGNYKRPNLKISFRLKQFYVNAAGEKVETAASAAQTGIFAPKTIAENTVLDEKAGAVTITKEATTGAEWNVLWNNLPAEGEEAGTAVTYFYEVEELGVTASDVDAKADYETTYSEDKLTVTNRYNKATSAAVEKAWSDGKPHDDVNVTMTLYKSYIAYDGTGSLYSANVQVENWKDTNGNAGTAPDGAEDKISVTIKKKSTDTAVATFDLTATNSWTHDTGNVLRKGTEYVVSWEAANGVKGAKLLSALDDQIKLTGIVAARANTITVTDTGDSQRTTLSTASPSVTLTLKYYTYGSSVNVTVDANGGAKVSTPVVTSEKKNGNDYNTRIYTVTGISRDTTIHYEATKSHYLETVELAEAASGGSTVSPTGSEDYIVYSDAQEQMPANGDLTEVGSVVLNKDALAGIWAYEWGNLPLSDATSELYYYVKETAISDSALVEGEPEVEYEFRDAEPRTIARVKITNTVKGGELEISKAATFDPTDNGTNANKLYSFNVQNEDGKYVQNLKGDLGDTIKWFTLKAGDTVSFPNLSAGKYTVTEDERAAKVNGYELAVSGDGEVTVVKGQKVTAPLVNTYTEEKGSLKVAKVFTGLSYADLTSEQKQALAKVYFTVTNSSDVEIDKIYLKVDQDNMEEDLTRTIANLKLGAYTVTEAIPNDSVPAGYEYKSTTVTVTGGTGTTGEKTATATVAANQTVTVTFDNEYKTSTADLTVKKKINKANSSANPVTFYVGLFVDAAGTTLVDQDIAGDNPRAITFAANSTDKENTATFEGLTIGETYYVFETNAQGEKVKASDSVSGYAIKAEDVGGKTVEIAVSGNEVTINNEYSASGKAQLSAKKASNDTLGNRKFTFVQEAPDGTTTVSGEVTAGNSVSFPEISFDYTDLGTTGTKDYVYKIYETIPGNAVKEGEAKPYSEATDKTGTWVANGVSYDGTIHSVTIKVTDNGDGTLTVKYNGSDTFTTPEFTNSYEATGTGSLQGTKELNGGTLAAGTFSFIATADASNLPVDATGWHSAPSNEAGGRIDFGSLTFNQVGTWKYTIKENTTTQSDDTIYDLSEYEVTFKTTDNGDGTLSVAKTIKKVKDANGSSIDTAAQATQNDITVSFTNVKKGALKVKKNVTVNGQETTTQLADGTYNFTLTKKDDSSFQEQTITVTVSDGQSTFSNPVENLVPGTYVVTETPNQFGTTLTERNGGTESGENAIEIEVTAGETAEQNVAEFTNDKTVEGKITIKKSVTIKPSDKAKTSYQVTVVDSNGRYVKLNTETNKYVVEASDTAIYLNVPVNETGLVIKGLPIDTYTVTEYADGAQIDGYTLSAESVTNGTAALTITDNEKEVGLNNTYTRDEGELKIKKTGTVNGAADTEGIINGDYSFTVAGKADTDTAGNSVGIKITLANGVAIAAEKVGTSVPADVTVAFAEGIVTLGKLPTGSYIVTENLTTEQTNAGIHLLANNDIEISVTKEPETIPTAEFENTKSEKGKITVNKSVLYNGVADTEVENKTITVGLYKDEAAAQPVKHTVEEAEVNWTETITLNGSGTGTATFSELDYDTYYVFELGDDGASVKGDSGTINGVAYKVGYNGTNGPIALSHRNLEGTVNVTNEQTETGSLKVTKALKKGEEALTASEDVTFQVGLYKQVVTTNDDTTTTTWEPVKDPADTSVNWVKDITVPAGESANTAEVKFDGLTIGKTYRVYELTDAGAPVEADGHYKEYTVTYGNADGVEITRTAKDGETALTNTVETTEITALKKWANGAPPAGTQIVLTLYKDETKVSAITLDGTADAFPVAASEDDGSEDDEANDEHHFENEAWKAKWTDLPKYKNGAEIAYVVKETSYKIGNVEQLTIPKAADETEETTYDFYFTNELPKITIEGSKTWVDTKDTHEVPALTLTRKSAKQDSPTVTLRAADEANKTVFSAADTSANTGVNLQPVWTDLNYSYSDLPKYDAEGYLYTYTVTEDPIENYRSAAESSGDSSGFGQNFINTELTKIEADKEWLKADGVTTLEPEAGTEIDLKLVRYLADGETPDQTFTPVVVKLKGEAAEKAKITGTEIFGEEKVGWKYEWTELVKSYIEPAAQPQPGDAGSDDSDSGSTSGQKKDYVYKVEEVSIKYGSGTVQTVSDGISADHNFLVSYTIDQTTGKTIITNRENKTKIHLEKKWFENEDEVNTPTLDPNIDSITIQLWRKNGEAVQLDANTGRLPEEGATVLTRTLERTAKPDTDPVEYTWSWDIDNLEKSYWDNGVVKDYIYYVIEDVPGGWSVTYTNDVVDEHDPETEPEAYSAQRVKQVVDNQSGVEAAILGEGTITLKNSRYSVSLPSTGGPGTTMFYVVGSILTLLAAVLLITKKRTDGQGIE